MSTAVFPFFDLPAELRDLVYANLAHPTPWLRQDNIAATIYYAVEDTPETSCLLVSRRFKHEYTAQVQRTAKLLFLPRMKDFDAPPIWTPKFMDPVKKAEVTIVVQQTVLSQQLYWTRRLTQVLPFVRNLELSLQVGSHLIGQEPFKGTHWQSAMLGDFDGFKALPHLSRLHVLRHRAGYDDSEKKPVSFTSYWATWDRQSGWTVADSKQKGLCRYELDRSTEAQRD